MRWRATWLLCVLGCLAAAAPGATGATAELVDDFENPSLWSPHPADGVDLEIGSAEGLHGKALRLDFGFTGGGYAVARRALSIDLPENWAFRFQIRGEALPNHLEFKLLDESGDNVWWCVRRDMTFPATWEPVSIKKRQVSFAWGPLGGGEIRHVAAIEIVVTAGKGGRGTLFVDDLELIPLPPPDATLPAPEATASSSRHGHRPILALDGDAASFWSPSKSDAEPWIALDFGTMREWGGLIVDWVPGRHARDYNVDVSDDGTTWRTVRAVHGSNGGRDDLDAPEAESRYARLRFAKGGDPALREIRVQSLAWTATRESFFEAIARDAPRGTYPRGMSGEQVYWTVVGQDADVREGLLSEDGAVDTGKRRFSLEPFLRVEDRLLTWADVESEQTLDGGSLPIPSVTWRRSTLELQTTAFATGEPGASSILVQYRVRNLGASPRRVTLYVALRPFQVNPPSQFLNDVGGTAPVREIVRDDRVIRVNGDVFVHCLTPFADFGATTFDGGDIVEDWLRKGELPEASRVEDPREAASAALEYPLELKPGTEARVDLLVPLHTAGAVPPPDSDAAAWADQALEAARAAWVERTNRVAIDIPNAPRVVESLESQLAYILINRAGPAIQPGTRAYARSWIRDGALTASALLHLGHTDAARDFLEWFAPHQYENGKIPCVVDSRGADPVPEHDSSGEFIFLVAEIVRYTGDSKLAERMWPRVRAAAAYLDSLRSERRTDEYRSPDKVEFFGILPPSISHEGYSAKPMHSYWDDFWAVRGFRDAAWLAGELGRDADRARFDAIHVEFRKDLSASVEAAMRRHQIRYIPGCADLGDFDATSTTIALSPTSAAASLPRAALENTFEQYWGFFRERRDGASWDAYTPYEIRNIGAFVRLGRREDANELLDYFLANQRPVGFRQWPEVVTREVRKPRFLGDLPHTWVGSDYIRSVLDMLAFVSEEDEALVLGAGVPLAWLAPPGVSVRDLPTPWGRVAFTMRRAESGDIVTEVSGEMQVPPGGIRVRAPGCEEAVIRELPAKVVRAPSTADPKLGKPRSAARSR